MPKDKTDSHIRIIDAARKEFLEYGYNDASLRRIAANAGIQVSGLYKHFANKDEMFASLVEPAIEEFYKLYHDIESEYFDEVDHLDGKYEWEGDDETVREMEFIYDHIDEFKLLVTCSAGSRFEDFIHEVAMLEEDATLSYMKELEKKGYQTRHVDRDELHLLTTAYVESAFQPVIHGFDRKKAMHFATTLQDFYKPAWKALFGI